MHTDLAVKAAGSHTLKVVSFVNLPGHLLPILLLLSRLIRCWHHPTACCDYVVAYYVAACLARCHCWVLYYSRAVPASTARPPGQPSLKHGVFAHTDAILSSSHL